MAHLSLPTPPSLTGPEADKPVANNQAPADNLEDGAPLASPPSFVPPSNHTPAMSPSSPPSTSTPTASSTPTSPSTPPGKRKDREDSIEPESSGKRARTESPEAEADTNTGTDTGINAGIITGPNTDTNAGTGDSTNTGTNSNTNAGGNSDTNTGTGDGTNSDTNAGDNSDTNTGINTGTGNGTNTDTNPVDACPGLQESGVFPLRDSETSPIPEPPPTLRQNSSIFEGGPNGRRCCRTGECDDEFHQFVIQPEKVDITFNDVYSSPETINALRLLTLSLRDPSAFQVGILSRHSASGVLLYGPPGTGKTMLARALAKEAGTMMMAVSFADVQSSLVGEAEKKIRSLFAYARRHHPCIIFIDEADSCFRSRSAEHSPAHRTDFLNQFLTEMNGIDAQGACKPIVVAATNRPFDIDEGILRRLGSRIMVDIPDVRGRAAILKLQLAGETLHPDLDLAEIARHTQEFTGSDLRDLAFQAALEAVQEIYGETGLVADAQVSGPNKSGADRVIARKHFLLARKSVSPAPKADLVAKLAEFHSRHGGVGGGKGRSGK